MPSSTPYPGEVPYALDADPRALWPTTSLQLAERIAELTDSYACGGTQIGGSWTPGPAGADIPWSFGAEPGQPFAYAGGVITYSGPTRRFLVTLMATTSAGAPLTSAAWIGTASLERDRESAMSSGVGADANATHTHHVSMVVTMGPENVTTLVCGAASNAASVVDARLEVVSL